MQIMALRREVRDGAWQNRGTVNGMELTEGERLRLRRERLGLSREKLTKLAGVSVGAIFRAEHDENVETFTRDAIIGALDREERKRLTKTGLDGSGENQVESLASNHQPISESTRRSAETSAASAPLTSPVPSPNDDVLTEDERAMLTPIEQHIIRRYRTSNPTDRERIARMVEVISGDAEERAKGSTGTVDSQPARFRRS
jgi:transcriptional regulator with XRE-family HTH domain